MKHKLDNAQNGKGFGSQIGKKEKWKLLVWRPKAFTEFQECVTRSFRMGIINNKKCHAAISFYVEPCK